MGGHRSNVWTYKAEHKGYVSWREGPGSWEFMRQVWVYTLWYIGCFGSGHYVENALGRFGC